jgi:4,5-DOPA dioxygenase extradiol
MPAVFISHGSPMVAIQRGAYQDALAAFGHKLRPRAILAISAHWGSHRSIGITGAVRHSTIHDFGGFAPELYELTYNAPGSPELAQRVVDLFSQVGLQSTITVNRGLDHGVWIPLHLMFPEPDIPVVALSVPLQFSPEELYQLGEILAPLRQEGTLIIGSGGVVHNLGLVHFENEDAPIDPWASEFDSWFRNAIRHRNLPELFNFASKAPHAALAVPTFEHFAPVFVTLGAGGAGEASTIFEGFVHGNVSMRSFAIA